MRITKIETIRVAAEPRVIWVHAHTDAGIVGLGETYYAPTVVQAAIHDHFGPLLIGRDPFAVERHWEAMFRLSDHAGYGGAEMRAISALDMALWDIKGQAAQRSEGTRLNFSHSQISYAVFCLKKKKNTTTN